MKRGSAIIFIILFLYLSSCAVVHRRQPKWYSQEEIEQARIEKRKRETTGIIVMYIILGVTFIYYVTEQH